ncbi:MAG: CHASE2 domain-containing protein [Elusimicrobiota bacterium]|nr:MAG: CHASE2 domain-containing protein [Elusimicrobiota bacterium]
MPKALRILLPLAVLLAGTGALVLALRLAEPMRAVELKTLDWRSRLLSDPSRADGRIVHVTIDQASIDHFEAEGMYWPWPRGIYEALLRFMKTAGAKAVVLDVLFTNPSTAEDDAVLARAAKDFGAVVAAMETGAAPDPRRKQPPPARFALEGAAEGPERRSVRLPIPGLLAAARFVADTKVEPDFDGVFRRVPVAVRLDGRTYPTLPAAAAMIATGKTLAELAPRLVDGRMLVRFHGKSMTSDREKKTYAAYPFGDVVLAQQSLDEKRRPALDPSLFKDKIVFVGMSAAGLLDNHPTPISPSCPAPRSSPRPPTTS